MIVNIERARLQHSDPRLSVQPALDRHHRGRDRRDFAGRDRRWPASSRRIALRQFGDSLRPVISAVGGVLFSILIFIVDLLLAPDRTADAAHQGRGAGAGRSAWAHCCSGFDSLGLKINLGLGAGSIETFLNSPGFLTVSARHTDGRGADCLLSSPSSGRCTDRGCCPAATSTRPARASLRANCWSSRLKHSVESPAPEARAPTRSLYLPLSGDDPRHTVRRVYQEFLEWTRVRVRARAPHQTPWPYAQRIGGLSTAQQEPVSRLTALYLRARYAADDADPRRSANRARGARSSASQSPVIQSPLSED